MTDKADCPVHMTKTAENCIAAPEPDWHEDIDAAIKEFVRHE
jgi:hypothetical protein